MPLLQTSLRVLGARSAAAAPAGQGRDEEGAPDAARAARPDRGARAQTIAPTVETPRLGGGGAGAE